MAWFTAIACVGILAFITFEHSERFPPARRDPFRKWFVGWLIKGAVIPAAIWAFFNSGILERVPALLISVDQARPGLARTQAVLSAIELGSFAIATYWTGLTAAWLLYEFHREPDAPKNFRAVALSWSILLGPIALLTWAHFGWYGAGLGAALWGLPLLQIVSLLAPPPVLKPSYTRAIARMHFDKYDQAEAAVIEELEKCEHDFEGWMLLAELYAVHFHDLPEAERTLRETCAQPTTTDSQRSIALHKLADWSLKLAHDPVAARRHLSELCATAQSPHLIRMARQRLDQLPETKEEWVEQHEGKKYQLPALRSDFDAAAPAAIPAAAAEQAVLRARQLSERLHKNPNDARDREALARLLAENLNKVDAALEQLELLLTIPDQPEQKRAEWLALMAAWELRYKRNEVAGRKILERLVRQFPQSAAGFAAQRRLNLMDLESKLRAARNSENGPTKITLLPS